ncbi:DUF6763 family protein [Kangiella sediminilitoris]|uniref:Uncharacterized protein n=1 Tax=Kangiella sediminilitoris TaxID=1144748 RepID=A0A1B3BAA2_9GAMM|nr:DUF6763 family protein [Kangiella sediminilitoris]AOE49684.1 hypothetical protein KS2013_963 [Kangiella sediminilitoris]
MGQTIHPERGQWYKRLDLDASFEVVAIDRDEQCIEIQYYSGEIEEIDQASWEQLELTPIAPPDNWSGAFGTDNRVELEDQADSLESVLSFMDANNI